MQRHELEKILAGFSRCSIAVLGDVMLDEFTDEIDEWVIQALQSIGCDTAKSVLAIPDAEIARRADLEIETVAEVKRILNSEFEENN